jgi:hypothetical protein
LAQWVVPEEFDRVLASKPRKVQGRFFRALQQMDEDLGHPSLRTAKLQGRQDQWYSRASRADRITFFREGDRIILIMNCGHEIL